MKKFWERLKNTASFRRRYLEGYNWKPYTPYNARVSQKRKQGICNAFNLHYPNRNGSWCFGCDYVCGFCNMNVGRWPQSKVNSVVARINRMDVDDEQRGLALEMAARTAANSDAQ